jgi:hypothetical protein
LKCPRCGHEELIPPLPCPECEFSGSLSQIEELSHVRYLLGELAGWQELSSAAKEQLQKRYLRRQRELEIELGLRLPPLTPEEAHHAAREKLRLQQLLYLFDHWNERGWIKRDAADGLVARSRERIEELRVRLAEPDTPSILLAFDDPTVRVALLKSLHNELDWLHQEGAWVDKTAYQSAGTDLDERVEQLEIRLGLRRPPKKEPIPVAPEPLPTPKPAAPPREPITWERVWRTLLSERTLRVLLFVGVFLLFVSAITLVAFNWERFHPLVQVAFLTAFTLFFYGLGWYVRVKMGLRESGIALSATGSLLAPLDFYAIYLSGGIFPPEAWAEVWLIASVVCLLVYTFTAAVVRAEFFGYLVGAAAGSLLCAVLQLTGVPGDWWSPMLCGLALLLMLLATQEEKPGFSEKTRFLEIVGRPFRHLALLTVTSVLLLATGLRIVEWLFGDPFRLTLALDWWLACTVYTIAAARYPRRSLTSAACFTAPGAFYLTLSLYFEATETGFAWHALGWALLTPIYLILAYALQRRAENEARQAQGRTVAGWAVALILWAAIWGLGDMSAAAAAHAVLIGSVVLAAVLWQRPRLLLVASFFSLSTVATWMATLGLDLAQYSLGWALLAILHVAIAVLLHRAGRYTPLLYVAGCGAALLSFLLPLLVLGRGLMAYALFNWIALSGWAARLAHQGEEEHPGLHQLLRLAGPLRQSVLHWAAALPILAWFWLAWTQNVRPIDAWLGVGFAVLAWVLVGLGRRLARHENVYGLPWYTTSFLSSVIGIVVARDCYDRPLLAIALLSGAALYFFYARLFRQRWWLPVGGFTFPCGYILALAHLNLPLDPLAASLTLVPAAYLLGSFWLERRRQVEADFLKPLQGVAHVVAAAAFCWGFGGLWNRVAWGVSWTDPARLWAAGGQLVLGVTYGLAAWYQEKEIPGHVAAWLGVVAGGLVATVYSRGRGSSAAKAALLAIVYALAERTLHALRERHPLPCKAWPLYRRPLLIAGWAVSGGTVMLALVRNLLLLGGGPVREDWSIVGLLLIVGLYASSARLFRRPLFLWLAAPLLFAPWTLLTHRGWYVWTAPPATCYALAWAVLAWALMSVGLLLDRFAGKQYGRPLRVTAHVLLPFALLWGAGDAATSSATFGLGAALYVLAAITDHRRGREGLAAARFLYPAAFLTPVWAVYLLAWQKPWLPHAHFGLLLLMLSPLAFFAARRLRHVDPADALPAYLSSYGCAIAGTMLVSYEQPLLALALLFDAGLALVSARLLREPLWIYPAAALPPASLLLALVGADSDPYRRGWWLIGLGAIYLAQSWALRRISAHRYAVPLMAAAYAIVALGLPVSSYDQIAAFWAYGGAALFYAISAAWLREPLLLTPAAALSAVPYAILLHHIAWIAPADYGLVLWPGVIIALAVAHLLDRFLGAPRDFPWNRPGHWFPEAARRLTDWWGLPLYGMGYLGALVGAGLSLAYPVRLMVTLALAAATYGLATARFRLRGWLLVAVAAAQAAALTVIWAAAEGLLGLSQAWVGRLGFLAWWAFVFLPVTIATAVAGLWIERRRSEGSPLVNLRALWKGWSRPLYWLLALDLLVVQIVSITRTHPGAFVSLVHALLLVVLAVAWAHPTLPYLPAGLGFLAIIQWLVWVGAPMTDMPVALALLALGYGLVGCGLEYARRCGQAGKLALLQVLERPLERAGLAVSAVAILGMLRVGMRIWGWLLRALFLGRPLMTSEDVAIVQMAVGVLALVGLLYLAAALVRRWYWRGYGAVALLLCAWSLEWFLVRNLREVQWYAIPAGLYLLGVGYLEWRQGRKGMARWIDRAALLLLLGSSFYQSLAERYGWPYALLMGAESLFLVWWGSARRQRRFLYFGVVGVVTAVGGQLVKQLFSANAFIAFGVPGLVIMLVVILIERNLERIKQVSPELWKQLEEWE